MLLNLKKARTPRLILALTMAVALVVTGCGGKKEESGGGDVVATYKGGEVKKGELDTFTKTTGFFYPQFAQAGETAEMQDYMLKQLITVKVLSERATEESKKTADEETKNQMEQMEAYFTQQGADALDKQLKELNITKKDVETYMHRNILVITDANNKVTEDEAKAAYDKQIKENPSFFDVATVAHILVMLNDPNDQTKALRTKEEALARAKEIKGKLDQGGDFAALAKEYSDDPGSKDQGGVYADQRLGTVMWDPAFKQAAVDQAVGVVGEPFESSFGYHIMRVDKREPLAYDSVKSEVKSEIAEASINDFITKELVDELEFKNLLPSPSPAASPEVSPEASPAQ